MSVLSRWAQGCAGRGARGSLEGNGGVYWRLGRARWRGTPIPRTTFMARCLPSAAQWRTSLPLVRHPLKASALPGGRLFGQLLPPSHALCPERLRGRPAMQGRNKEKGRRMRGAAPFGLRSSRGSEGRAARGKRSLETFSARIARPARPKATMSRPGELKLRITFYVRFVRLCDLSHGEVERCPYPTVSGAVTTVSTAPAWSIACPSTIEPSTLAGTSGEKKRERHWEAALPAKRRQSRIEGETMSRGRDGWRGRRYQ
jgi:hypothetical protein